MSNSIKRFYSREEALFYAIVFGLAAWALVILRALRVLNAGADNLIVIGILSIAGTAAGFAALRNTERKRLARTATVTNIALPLLLVIWWIASAAAMSGMH